VQITCGTWYLEDPSGAVLLDLSLAKFHTRFYSEACFVLTYCCVQMTYCTWYLEDPSGAVQLDLSLSKFHTNSTQRIACCFLMFGCVQITYGTWYPEDPSGTVKLDLSLAKFRTGLYAENCFVLNYVRLYADNLR